LAKATLGNIVFLQRFLLAIGGPLTLTKLDPLMLKIIDPLDAQVFEHGMA
jgi:hypothetical protein